MPARQDPDDSIAGIYVYRDELYWLLTNLKADVDVEYTVDQLKDYDTLQVIYIKDSVKPKIFLRTFKNEFKFNLAKVAKVDILEESYFAFRRVRGDGNCYYRSIIFGIIEELIKRDISQVPSDSYSYFESAATEPSDYCNRYKGFVTLASVFEPLTFDSSPDMEAHTKLLQYLVNAAENDIWKCPREFESCVLNPSSGLDLGSLLSIYF